MNRKVIVFFSFGLYSIILPPINCSIKILFQSTDIMPEFKPKLMLNWLRKVSKSLRTRCCWCRVFLPRCNRAAVFSFRKFFPTSYCEKLELTDFYSNCTTSLTSSTLDGAGRLGLIHFGRSTKPNKKSTKPKQNRIFFCEGELVSQRRNSS